LLDRVLAFPVNLLKTIAATGTIFSVKFSKNRPAPWTRWGSLSAPPDHVALTGSTPMKMVLIALMHVVPICLYYLNCAEFGQLILRKIIKIVATICQILRLKCTQFDFSWDSAVRPIYPLGELTALLQTP